MSSQQHKEIDLKPLRITIIDIIDKERRFFEEYSKDEAACPTSSVSLIGETPVNASGLPNYDENKQHHDQKTILWSKFLDFCRTEDNLYFEAQLEYFDIKRSKELIELFEKDILFM